MTHCHMVGHAREYHRCVLHIVLCGWVSLLRSSLRVLTAMVRWMVQPRQTCDLGLISRVMYVQMLCVLTGMETVARRVTVARKVTTAEQTMVQPKSMDRPDVVLSLVQRPTPIVALWVMVAAVLFSAEIVARRRRVAAVECDRGVVGQAGAFHVRVLLRERRVDQRQTAAVDF
jgi:beta-lactamase regulating signal transducer with metallopeptidase domain